MSELDQLDAFAQIDSQNRLGRAAQAAHREDIAAETVASCLAQTRLPWQELSGLPVALALPPELHTVGDLACALYSNAPVTRRASPVNLGVAPWPMLQVEDQILDLTPYVHGNMHPAHALLVLLGLLSALRGPTPLGRPYAPTLLDALARCRPEVPTADNPAKQLALRIHDRVPCFWGTGIERLIARDWSVRLLWNAESIALAAGQDELSRLWTMARFPRFWPNVAVLVRLVTPEASADLPDALTRLLARRRFALHELHAPASLSGLDRALYWLELGEWIALYAAALNNVDPAALVPLDILFGAS